MYTGVHVFKLIDLFKLFLIQFVIQLFKTSPFLYNLPLILNCFDKTSYRIFCSKIDQNVVSRIY